MDKTENATQVWNQISTDAMVMAWSEWDVPGGFRQRFEADPVQAIRDAFGIEVTGSLSHIALPPPPHLSVQAVQGAKGAEAAYPFTCC